jgi:hypothetical protein
MIEIKITIDDAFQLLLERVNYEMRMRQKVGFVSPDLQLENLSYLELKSIVDVAIFDTLTLLPADLITNESNLASIVTATVRLLPKILHREEFYIFNELKSRNLIKRIQTIFKTNTDQNIFLQN